MASMADIYAQVKLDLAKQEEDRLRKKIGSIDTKAAGAKVATRFGAGFNGAIGSIVSRSAGIFAAGFAAVKVGGFLKGAISQASDLGETTSKVTQIFGPAAKDIMAFSKTASTALGQTQQAALDANATFGTFGKSAGLKGSELSGFTTKLTTLAGDLASFNNTSPEQAIEAIGAALRGESEPIRAYGVLLDDASLRQEALSQGLIKTTKQALTPQQKVLAAQALIMKQTTTAQGDFARTSGGLANQQRILSARFSDLKTGIGAIALPLVVKFFGFLNDKAIPVLGEIKGGILAFGSAFQANDGDITSSGFPGFMEHLGFAAAQAFDVFKTSVLPRLRDFGGFIRGTAVPALKDFGGFIVGTVVPAVGNLVSSLTPLAKDVGTAAVGIFERLGPVLQSIGQFIAGTIVPAIVDFTKWLKDNSTVVGAVAVGVGAMVLAFKAYQLAVTVVTGVIKAYTIAQVILDKVMKLSTFGVVITLVIGLAAALIYAYKKSETFRNIVNGVWNAIKTTAQAVFGAVIGFVKGAIDWVSTNFPKILAVIMYPFTKGQELIGAAWKAITGFVRGTIDWISANFPKVVGYITAPFATVVQALGTAWGAIKTAAKTAIKFVVDKFLGLVESILTGAGKAFGWVPGLGDKLKGAATEFGKFRDSVNAKLDGINDEPVDIKVGLAYTQALGQKTKQMAFADGGGVFGGQRGKDSVPALLMPDEHVWTTKEVAAAGGHGAMKRMRRAALAGELYGYANGGVVVKPRIPSNRRLQSLANAAAGAVDHTGSVMAAAIAKNLVAGPGGPPGAKRAFRGVTLNQRTIGMLLNAERLLGAVFHITQGSYSTRVAASGGTHAGGGAMDTDGPRGWDKAVRALRSAGFASWHRTPAQGPWNHHIHSIALGDSSASPSAKAQMASFRRGGDGLGALGMAKGGSVGSYAEGAWKILADQLAIVHKDEMVVPAKSAGYLRKLLPVLPSLSVGRVRSKLHRLHETHQAHLAHVGHLNHLNALGHIPTRTQAIGADFTGNGVTGNVRLHPDDMRHLGRVVADELRDNPMQVLLDGRRVDAEFTRRALRG